MLLKKYLEIKLFCLERTVKLEAPKRNGKPCKQPCIVISRKLVHAFHSL